MSPNPRPPTLRWSAGSFALLAGYGLLFGPVLAQPPATKPAAPPAAPDPAKASELQVIALKYVHATELTRTLTQMFAADARGSPLRFVADERTNTILISAPPAEFATIKDVIAKLDTPAKEDSASHLKLFHLRFIEPDKAFEEALGLVFKSGGQASVDRQRKLVIVSADARTLEAAEVLIANLDRSAETRPAQDVQVRVIWLVNGLAREDAPQPPDDLKEVLPALAKLGIDKPRLAAQTLVNVAPNATFATQGVAKLDAPCQFSVSGLLGDKPEASGLQINIQASRMRDRGLEQICTLQTQINAPPGHFVVLGMTPTDAMTSVFVVQVRRQEAKQPGAQK